MKLYVSALNSGSNGNCYYVGNDWEGVLIDAGISCREIERRLKRLEIPVRRIKAVFITHEHTDHIKGTDSFSLKYKLPVYITPGTLGNARVNTRNPYLVKLNTLQPVKIGNLTITSFPKFHDANDPQSIIVNYEDVCVGIFTDIGYACHEVIRHFKCCNAIFLETNYDEAMLETGNYPVFLKNRIRSKTGHLSNKEALELVVNHRSDNLTHLFLSHISKENNDPELVLQLFKKNLHNINVVLTQRHQEIPLYEIGAAVFKPYQTSLTFY